jgi:hypothetical protein
MLISESLSASKAYSTLINFLFCLPLEWGLGGRNDESVCARRIVGMEVGLKAVGWTAFDGIAWAGRKDVLLPWTGDDLEDEVVFLYFVLITGRGTSIWTGSSVMSGV